MSFPRTERFQGKSSRVPVRAKKNKQLKDDQPKGPPGQNREPEDLPGQEQGQTTREEPRSVSSSSYESTFSDMEEDLWRRYEKKAETQGACARAIKQFELDLKKQEGMLEELMLENKCVTDEHLVESGRHLRHREKYKQFNEEITNERVQHKSNLMSITVVRADTNAIQKDIATLHQHILDLENRRDFTDKKMKEKIADLKEELYREEEMTKKMQEEVRIADGRCSYLVEQLNEYKRRMTKARQVNREPKPRIRLPDIEDGNNQRQRQESQSHSPKTNTVRSPPIASSPIKEELLLPAIKDQNEDKSSRINDRIATSSPPIVSNQIKNQVQTKYQVQTPTANRSAVMSPIISNYINGKLPLPPIKDKNEDKPHQTSYRTALSSPPIVSNYTKNGMYNEYQVQTPTTNRSAVASPIASNSFNGKLPLPSIQDKNDDKPPRIYDRTAASSPPIVSSFIKNGMYNEYQIQTPTTNRSAVASPIASNSFNGKLPLPSIQDKNDDKPPRIYDRTAASSPPIVSSFIKNGMYNEYQIQTPTTNRSAVASPIASNSFNGMLPLPPITGKNEDKPPRIYDRTAASSPPIVSSYIQNGMYNEYQVQTPTTNRSAVASPIASNSFNGMLPLPPITDKNDDKPPRIYDRTAASSPPIVSSYIQNGMYNEYQVQTPTTNRSAAMSPIASNSINGKLPLPPIKGQNEDKPHLTSYRTASASPSIVSSYITHELSNEDQVQPFRSNTSVAMSPIAVSIIKDEDNQQPVKVQRASLARSPPIVSAYIQNELYKQDQGQSSPQPVSSPVGSPPVVAKSFKDELPLPPVKHQKHLNKPPVKHQKDLNKPPVKHQKHLNKPAVKHQKHLNKPPVKHQNDLNKKSHPAFVPHPPKAPKQIQRPKANRVRSQKLTQLSPLDRKSPVVVKREENVVTERRGGVRMDFCF